MIHEIRACERDKYRGGTVCLSDQGVGRAVAGWPAVALLVAMKLIFGLLNGNTSVVPRGLQGEAEAGGRPSPHGPLRPRPERAGTNAVPPGPQPDSPGTSRC